VTDISKVAVPDIIEEIEYKTLKESVLSYLRSIFAENLKFLESDSVTLVVEALIYREMLLRAKINEAMRAAFLPTANGTNLDNLGINYGVIRLENESDEAFRRRILLSLDRFSTAGSLGAYIYQTMSVDSAIIDVRVFEGEPGHVDVVYYAKPDSLELKSRIEAHLNKDTVRPLTDIVSVRAATRVDVNIVLDVYLYQIADSESVKSEILSRFAAMSFRIGEDLPKAKIIAIAMTPLVFDVKSNIDDVECPNDAIVNIQSITINTFEAMP
jgi:phage-related baseplate assembly protein